MKIKRLFPVVGLAVMLAACSSDKAEEPVVPVPDPEPNTEINDTRVPIDTLNNIEFTAQEAVANDALNEFGVRFLNTVIEKYEAGEIEKYEAGENIAVSPFSAFTCMTIGANTMNADFERCVLEILGQNDAAVLNSTVNKLIRFLPSRANGNELWVANSAWVSDKITPSEAWTQNLQSTFFSSIHTVDYMDFLGVKGEIDYWCNVNTNGLIPAMPTTYNLNSKVLLANALYFAGQWSEKFDKSLTTTENFRGIAGTTAVAMMHQDGIKQYKRGSNYQSVSVGMGNTELIVLLPDENVSVADVAKSLTAADFNGMESAYVKLSMPRFDVRTVLMPKIFEALGLPDESVIAMMGLDHKTPTMMLQQAFTSIDEEGAKVGAVTILGNLGADVSDPKEITFTVDRPFLYVIRNITTGTVLITGVIKNITK